MARRGQARSVECKCEYNFTCGHCMKTAPPWFFTLSDGSAIYEIPLQGVKHDTSVSDVRN